MTYPTLLESKSPKVMVYSKESIIAEKFQAMVALTVFNSRMKDFYDIYNIAVKEEFYYKTLKEAISETFRKRQTDISNVSVIFSKQFTSDNERIKQWEAFLRRINSNENLEYSEIMVVLEKFLEPVVDGILKQECILDKWDNENMKWL